MCPLLALPVPLLSLLGKAKHGGMARPGFLEALLVLCKAGLEQRGRRSPQSEVDVPHHLGAAPPAEPPSFLTVSPQAGQLARSNLLPLVAGWGRGGHREPTPRSCLPIEDSLGQTPESCSG